MVLDRVRGMWLRLRSVVRRGAAERELEEELRFHIELEAERRVRGGADAESALRDARLAFGGYERYREASRDARGVRWLEELAGDVRLSARQLRRGPGFAALAILTLALGIGANTAVFSVVDAVLIRPLPFPDPERLVTVRARARHDGYRHPLSPADVAAWQETGRAFEKVGAFYRLPAGLTVRGPGEPHAVQAMLVTHELFDVLGIRPARGRSFLAGEGAAGTPRVALVSDAFWRTHLGATPNVPGHAITMAGEPVTVVGVLPAGFRWEGAPDVAVWLPVQRRELTRRGPFFLNGVGRLAPGVTLEQARADMERVTAAVNERFPPEANGAWDFVLSPMKQSLVEESSTTLLLLLGAVGLVLLVAIGNVTNLFLARAAARERETAVKLALGAGRLRLIRQHVTESLLVSALGAAAGVAIAAASLPLVVRSTSSFLPRSHHIALDVRVLVFAVATALLAALLVGITPALRADARGLTRRLREATHGVIGARSARLRRWLVGAELALAFTVLIGALLLVRSLQHLHAVDAGVSTRGVTTARISLGDSDYPDGESFTRFYRALLERYGNIPGVEHVAIATSLPPDRLFFENDVAPVGHPPDRPTPIVHQVLVSEEYFDALGIRLLRGRTFQATDGADSPPVLVVSRALAERFWPGEDALGKRVVRGGTEATVVGIVADVKYSGLAADGAEAFYTPYFQSLFFNSVYVAVRSDRAERDLVPLLRRELRAVDPGIALQDVASLERVFRDSVASPRFRSLLLSSFALLALVLAMAGVYGVLAYTVNERRRETGVRMALGARAGGVVLLVLRDGLRLIAAGLLAGVALALGGARLLSGMLFGIGTLDPASWLAAAALLVGVGAVAAAVPAMRAARQDPMIALRAE